MEILTVRQRNFTRLLTPLHTVKPVYSGHAIQRTPANSGHFFMEPAESRSNSHRKTSLWRTLLERTFVIADTFFEHCVSILGKIYLLIADTLWLVGKKENACMFLFDAFLYFNMKLVIYFFQTIFHSCYNSCISIKKIVYRYFESQSNTTIDSFSSHFYTNVMICKLKKFGSYFIEV